MSTSNQAEVLLQHALEALAPLVQAAVREGVTYPAFAHALKATFFEAGRVELAKQGKKQTDSAVSVVSGVHRKDVKALKQTSPRLPKVLSVASQVYTQWLVLPDFRAPDGNPMTLARSGEHPSFESLAQSVTKNVHPRTILDELVRLKLITVDGESVLPHARSFVPTEGYADMATFMALNLADHAAAATQNLAGKSPAFLEQSVFADGITAESVELLALLARQSWKRTFDDTVTLATQRYARDQPLDGQKMRMRVGMYFYAEDLPPTPASDSGESP